MRPTSWSCLPAITVRSSSVSLPHCSLAFPVNCFQLPSMRSQFMTRSCSLLRGRSRPTSINDEAAAPLAAVDNPEAALALKELSSVLWELSPQSREALVLVGAGGFSYEEAATLCGCSVGTLKARVSRARKQLAGKLG